MKGISPGRSLQPRGLAETLCGSPLYMAPEIMQLQKYDAKVISLIPSFNVIVNIVLKLVYSYCWSYRQISGVLV